MVVEVLEIPLHLAHLAAEVVVHQVLLGKKAQKRTSRVVVSEVVVGHTVAVAVDYHQFLEATTLVLVAEAQSALFGPAVLVLFPRLMWRNET